MATQIAEAYVQIKPTTKGIKSELNSQLGGDLKSVGETSGSTMGSALVGKLKGILAAAGIAEFVKQALDAGGAVQQSFGGLDTLYGEASDAAKKYAREAAAAGISMNDYAEQAVSFGAGLKAAFDGDTTKAVEAANTALLDMADNAAKMGTPIESIQTAYQGFAKQNYTMLDNLKLGYGGTKTEMERLLKDAQKISGVKYDMDNLGDVYEAIHVIQGELGLTGVAAEEASTTFTGSMGAMKASMTNFLADLTTGGDVTQSLTTLISSVGTFLFNNLIPMLTNLVKALPGVVVTLIKEGIPQVISGVSELLNSIMGTLDGSLDDYLDKGIEMISSLANGIFENIPAAIEKIGEVMNKIFEYIMQNYPMILQKGFELISNLAQGFIKNLPAIVTSVIKVIAKFIETVAKNLPQILETGITILGKLAAGIIKAIPALISQLPQVINAIKNTFNNIDWRELGSNIIQGIKNGIINGVGAIVDAAKEAASAALRAAKNALGIHSPSRVFRDQIGAMIPSGMAIGIEDNMSDVVNAMDSLNDTTLSSGMDALNYSASYNAQLTPTNDARIDAIISILNEYLPSVGNQQIVLDTGTLVGATASKMDSELGKLATRNMRGVAFA